jgi:hypothetical protein
VKSNDSQVQVEFACDGSCFSRGPGGTYTEQDIPSFVGAGDIKQWKFLDKIFIYFYV